MNTFTTHTKYMLTAVFAVLIMLSIISTTSAEEVIDQEYLAFNGGSLTIGTESYGAVTQTFTVGVDGKLSSIDSALTYYTNRIPAVDITVSVVTTNPNGTPTNNVLSSVTLSASDLPPYFPYDGLLHIEFEPVEVTVGEILGIRYAAIAPSQYQYAMRGVGGGYSGGALYPVTSIDSSFRTYVDLGGPGTTDTGTDVEVTPDAVDENGDPIGESPISFTFDNVTGGGETTVTVSEAGTPPPSGFRIGNPPTYFNLETTATFDGAVEVCIDYTNTNYNDETTLKLMHNGTGGWTDITTSLDIVANIICGSTNSFSEFAVFEEKTLVELLAELRTNTQGINAKNGVANSLDGKLNAVQNAIDDTNENNDGAATNALEAYIMTTENQAGKGTITQEDASALINLAQEILSLL